MVQFLTRAGWGVAVRRIPEVMMHTFLCLAILFLPLLFGLDHLYHWFDPAHRAHDHLLQIKAPYLNSTFFYIRMIFYFLVWIKITHFFYNHSTKQDSDGDLRALRRAVPAPKQVRSQELLPPIEGRGLYASADHRTEHDAAGSCHGRSARGSRPRLRLGHRQSQRADPPDLGESARRIMGPQCLSTPTYNEHTMPQSGVIRPDTSIRTPACWC